MNRPKELSAKSSIDQTNDTAQESAEHDLAVFQLDYAAPDSGHLTQRNLDRPGRVGQYKGTDDQLFGDGAFLYGGNQVIHSQGTGGYDGVHTGAAMDTDHFQETAPDGW